MQEEYSVYMPYDYCTKLLIAMYAFNSPTPLASRAGGRPLRGGEEVLRTKPSKPVVVLVITKNKKITPSPYTSAA